LNGVVAWSKVDGFQSAGVWQDAQGWSNWPSCGSSAAWQASHVVPSPVHFRST
jgi:hypothetical protein